MSRTLKMLFLVTDFGFVLYWGATILATFGIVHIPQDWLFRDYTNPNIIAWNWSFLPLDLIASATGITAVSMATRNKKWEKLALISLCLTFCAGFMAISFWVFQMSFDALWWASNLFLAIWPIWFGYKILRK
ncbi:MAG: hypothetical protein COA84_11550 [Robiginitomaculum sp.]|nr:MAG: hypothetical protein COA84_11550 [Robiginitomaculum sp.]